jgi:hypothetical protein
MRADGAWKPAEAVWDPRGPIPSATSIQGPDYDDFSPGSTGRVLDGVRWRK